MKRQQMKRHIIAWSKISVLSGAIDVFDKGYISIMYKELQKLSNKTP